MLSAFADEYGESLEEQLEGLQRFGIDRIELRHVNGKNVSALTAQEVDAIGRALDAHGIRVSAIGSPLGKIRLDEDMDEHLKLAAHVCSIAAQLGTPYVRMFSFYAPRGRDITAMREEVLRALDAMLTLARRCGVTLCHENEARIYGDIPSRCREILDAFGGEMRCVFDMGNFVLEGIDPYPEAYELLKPYIAYFHIKDALAQGAIVPPGKGDARIRDILRAHSMAVSQDFVVSLEPHLQTFSGLHALVGRGFENPYRYPDAKTAFADAATKLREMIDA